MKRIADWSGRLSKNRKSGYDTTDVGPCPNRFRECPCRWYLEPYFARVLLKPRKARPFFGRHPWVLDSAIDRIEGSPADGDVVELCSDKAGVHRPRNLQWPQPHPREAL